MDELNVLDTAEDYAVVQEERAQVGVRRPSLEELAASGLRSLFARDTEMARCLAVAVVALSWRRDVIDGLQRMGIDHEDEMLRPLEEGYAWLRRDVAILADKAAEGAAEQLGVLSAARGL